MATCLKDHVVELLRRRGYELQWTQKVKGLGELTGWAAHEKTPVIVQVASGDGYVEVFSPVSIATNVESFLNDISTL